MQPPVEGVGPVQSPEVTRGAMAHGQDSGELVVGAHIVEGEVVRGRVNVLGGLVEEGGRAGRGAEGEEMRQGGKGGRRMRREGRLDAG